MNHRACRASMPRMKHSEPPGDDTMQSCDECGDEVPISELEEVKGYDSKKRKVVTKHVCSACFDKNYFKCDSCGQSSSNDVEHYIEETGEHLCDECFEKDYSVCDICDASVSREKTTLFKGMAYCEKCKDKYLATCSRCDKIIHQDAASVYKGDYFCYSCFDDKFSKCNVCDEWFPNHELQPLGQGGENLVCEKCIKHDDLVECNACKSYFNEDEMIVKRGETICMYCMEEKLIDDARKMFSTADVKKAYPDLEKRLAKVFALSAEHRTKDARYYYKKLRVMFPDVRMNYDDFTYINEIGNRKSLTELSSPKNSLNKRLADPSQVKAMNMYINKITNTFSDVNRLVDVEQKETHERVIDALKMRMYNEKNDPELKRETDAIVGEKVYSKGRIDPEAYTFVITKDPVWIVAKTTSQCWEEMSCEKVIRGAFGEGAFSDISNSNLVCFLLDKEKLPVGRIMIRWCRTEKGKIDFGIEKKWYYCTNYPEHVNLFNMMGDSTSAKSTDHFLGGLSMRTATEFLVSMLKEKGKHQDYASCTTPYPYRGYSDTQGKGGTKIEYHRF